MRKDLVTYKSRVTSKDYILSLPDIIEKQRDKIECLEAKVFNLENSIHYLQQEGDLAQQ